MSNNFVITIQGDEVPRIQCRYIQKQYYKTNRDCFLMPDGRWHRINNGKIEFDHEYQKYVLKELSDLYFGIVDFKDNTPIKGYFSYNPLKNVELNEENYAISEEVVNKCGYEEHLASGRFYPKGTLTNSHKTTKDIRNKYNFRLEYSAANSSPHFQECYDKFDTKLINNKFFNEFKSSVGVEFETENGFVPYRFTLQNGLIPLRDGSLRHDGKEPYEYTTVPLCGTKGLSTLSHSIDVLQKYTEVGHRCALHVHIGSYLISKEFIVALYRVILKIQDELYSMFPENYKYTSQNGFKQKDYCAPLKNIRLSKSGTVDENFDRIYKYLCDGMEPFMGFGVTNHPADRGNNRKWDVAKRYSITNLIPAIWGSSGTVEWRLHPPSLNKGKVFNWIYICNAIMNYTHANRNEIAEFDSLKGLDLNTILDFTYSEELSNILKEYVNYRKELMTTMDRIGDAELKNDLQPVISFV